MNKILLISNYVFHYRVNNYNYFYDEFQKLGYEFIVLTPEVQKVSFEIKFPLIIENFNFNKYRKHIKRINPNVIINFLHLKNLIIFPLTYYCKIRKIPVIYWNFGINIYRQDSLFKNELYYHLHNLSDAIILYSPNEKKVIKAKNREKLFIAYNTLNFTNIKNESIFDKDYLRKNYHIKERNIILFVSRITPAKKVELLIEAFQSNSDVAVVIIGDGLNEIHYKQITGLLNFYYFNGVYDKEELGKFFYCSDIFCIPGNPGLALNEALFWGKPVITMKGRKTPEIYYLKNGYNGYIADSVEDMKRKAIGLLNDRARYLEMSENARKTYENEAHISRMFNGFKEAVDFVINKKNSKLKKR